MTTVMNCNSCRWCTDRNREDRTGRCEEPHAPRNARGEITSRTRLGSPACRKFQPVPVTNIVRKPAVRKTKKQVVEEDMTV